MPHAPDTIHQRRGGPNGTLRFLGKFNGRSYDVIVDAEEGTVKWEGGNVEKLLTERAKQKAQQKDTGECAGCKGSMLKFARGAWAVTKAKLGVDAAPEDVIEARTRVCLNCPSGFYRFGTCDETLGGCGCFLDAKVRLTKEVCPEGYWK